MRNIISLIFLIFSSITFAQSTSFVGKYEVKYDLKNAIIEYTLELNSDGTFLFHSYENHFQAKAPEKDKFGKGKWKAEKNIITFITQQEVDLNEKYTLNFSNSKARYMKKSPRDKSERVIKTGLKIYESDIFWIKGIHLYKKF